MNGADAAAVERASTPTAMTDEQAMWRVAMHNDTRAFAELVARWQTPIQRLACRMTGDEALGEDVSQEAFARIFARRKTWLSTARFSTWLWRIAMNLCRDELRRARRRFEVALEGDDAAELAIVSSEPSPIEQLATAEDSAHVRAALLKLSDELRCVVVLKHYEGLKFREIADVLEIPEGTVKSRMATALEQLNRIMKPALADGSTGLASGARAPALKCL